VDGPPPVKLVVFALGADDAALGEALDRLRATWGPIDHQGPDHPFEHTDYYLEEMGTGLRRRVVSFADLVPSERLADLKLQAAAVEDALRGPPPGRGRRANLDPGYLDLHKLVLASRKEGGPKVHLGKGVYADLITRYARGAFSPYEWAFADFRAGLYDRDLLAIRARYKMDLARLGAGSGGAATPISGS
jgi:hypothetical protein